MTDRPPDEILQLDVWNRDYGTPGPVEGTGYQLVTDKRWRQLEPGETVTKPQWLAEHGPVVEAPADGYPIGFAVKFADGHVATMNREHEVQTRRPATPAEVEELRPR